MLFHKVDKRYCCRIPTQALESHTHTHPSIHPSIRSVTARQTGQNTEEFPFCCDEFIYTVEAEIQEWKMLLDYIWRLVQYCSNIYDTTLWILFLYDSKVLLMSDGLNSTRARCCDWWHFFTLTCINRNNSQAVILPIIQMDCCTCSHGTEIKWTSRLCLHKCINVVLLVRVSPYVKCALIWRQQSEAMSLSLVINTYFSFTANGKIQSGSYLFSFGKTKPLNISMLKSTLLSQHFW